MQQPETNHLGVITHKFRQLNKSMHGDAPSEYWLRWSPELAAQFLLPYESSHPQGLDLDNRIDLDMSATRMVAGSETSSSSEALALDRSAV